MVFKTNKDKGNTGLGMAIAYFTSKGYTVSIPLNDTQDYDLVIEQGKKLQTVQVKATNCKTKYGVYQVPLKSCGGTKGKTYKTLVESYADILFILTGDRKMYCIPCMEIKNKATLNISKKIIEYEVHI